jgi:hypothetical protein
MSYFLNPAINNSSLNFIDPETGGCPAKFKDYLDGKVEDEKTPSLEKGDYLHKYILTPKEFAVVTVDMPTPAVKEIVLRAFKALALQMDAQQKKELDLASNKSTLMSIADELAWQKNWKEDTRFNKIIEQGVGYFNALKEAGDKTVLDGDLYETLKACAESIKQNDAAKLLLFDSPGQEVFNEIEMYWDETWKGMKLSFKAKLDRLVVDHNEKTFSIIDFKTTSKYIHNFPDSVEYYRYYRQLSFYEHAVKIWLKKQGYEDYTSDAHYIVAVETKGYHMTRVYIVSKEYLLKGAVETANLLTRIVHHHSTGDWVRPMEDQLTVNKTYELKPKEYSLESV